MPTLAANDLQSQLLTDLLVKQHQLPRPIAARMVTALHGAGVLVPPLPALAEAVVKKWGQLLAQLPDAQALDYEAVIEDVVNAMKGNAMEDVGTGQEAAAVVFINVVVPVDVNGTTIWGRVNATIRTPNADLMVAMVGAATDALRVLGAEGIYPDEWYPTPEAAQKRGSFSAAEKPAGPPQPATTSTTAGGPPKPPQASGGKPASVSHAQTSQQPVGFFKLIKNKSGAYGGVKFFFASNQDKLACTVFGSEWADTPEYKGYVEMAKAGELELDTVYALPAVRTAITVKEGQYWNWKGWAD